MSDKALDVDIKASATGRWPAFMRALKGMDFHA